MTNQSQPKDASVSSVLQTLGAGLVTRARIAGLELSIAKENALKIAAYGILATVFGIFSLAFVAIALLVIFWDDHRIFVSCCIAGFFTVLFMFFLGKARGLASDMPFAFSETKQILQKDAETLTAAIAPREDIDQAQTEKENK